MTTTKNDHEAAEYSRELATQLAYDRRHPESRWNRDQLDHCPACGFDLGTHRPKCPRSYGSGNYGNPNRPTGHGYCANCGHAPCIWHGAAKPSCLSSPHPITLQQHESRMIGARIDAMTADERRSALIFLSGANPELAERAIDYVHRTR